MIDVILSDLRGRYGDKVLLSPDDLVSVLGVSVGQQANLRSSGRFPVATTKIGHLVRVSIYDLAKFLSGECVNVVKKTKIDDKASLNRAQKKAIKGHLEKDWWLSFQIYVYMGLDKSSLGTSSLGHKKLVEKKMTPPLL